MNYHEKIENEETKFICKIYGEDVQYIINCQRWFNRFKEGYFSLEDSQ